VVDDGSTDATPQILATYGDKIKVVTIPVATGNKSYAQEQGISHVTSEVFIATDGDTISTHCLLSQSKRATRIRSGCGGRLRKEHAVQLGHRMPRD
jgi:glycosyltransferase involved in cell wall biosynthesis